MYIISPVYARVVVRELSRRGLPLSPLFRDTTLNKEILDIGGDISAEDYNTLLKNARDLSGDAELGLMIGKSSNIVSLGPVGAAMANAPTLREGLQILDAFTRLVTSYAEVSLRSTLRGLSLSLELTGIDGEIERFHVEAGFLLIQGYIEMIGGEPLTAANIRVSYDSPDYAGVYSEAFHSPVTFNAGSHSMELPKAGLDTPSPFFNAEVWLQAQFSLAQRLKDLTRTDHDTYTQHVQALLRSSEPPLPDLATVAEKMHMSERTLNRRLRGEDTSFRDIRSGELHSWSRRYLDNTDLSVEAIAALLGYQDAANFRRAFKTWESCSPAQFRDSLPTAG